MRDVVERTTSMIVLGFVVARRFGEVATAPRLGMGRHGRGQLIFKARGTLGYTVRRRGMGGAESGGGDSVRRGYAWE